MLQKLQDADLYAKLKKYIFHQSQVEFFGYIISNDGLMMDPKKIQAIIDWSNPKTICDVQYFLGFTNFYKILITNYSQVAALLTWQTYKDKLEWGSKAQKAFQDLKAIFTSAPISVHSDFFKPFYMGTDASYFELGVVCFKKEKRKGFIRLHSITENFLSQRSSTRFISRNS